MGELGDQRCWVGKGCLAEVEVMGGDYRPGREYWGHEKPLVCEDSLRAQAHGVALAYCNNQCARETRRVW